MKIRSLLLSLLLCLITFAGYTQSKKVYVLTLFDEIHNGSARYISLGFKEAHEAKADLILIHMNTYGGMVQYADTIRSTVLNSIIPTAVFIDKNAASAGALISIACDSIYMAKGANIGAATVVMGETGEAAPDKYQSYMRSTMRATAEENGRDPAIAEKMVDQNLEIPGLSPKGSVITFTPSEAIENGYAEGIKNSINEVLEVYGLGDAEVITYENSTVEKMIQFLINPAVSGILMMMIFGGIFFELKTPGLGFPSAVAAVGAILFFAPHDLYGLAESWEIILFFIGLIAIALEIFVIPGFGVAGIIGIVFTVGGITAALIKNDFFDFTFVGGEEILRALATTLLAMATSIILVIWIAKQFIADSKHNFPFVDHDTQDKEKGYTALDKNLVGYVGLKGKALTDLRPAGFIEIEGKRIDAETEGDFLSKGIEVEVLKVRGTFLVVKKA